MTARQWGSVFYCPRPTGGFAHSLQVMVVRGKPCALICEGDEFRSTIAAGWSQPNGYIVAECSVVYVVSV
jgi:hypothetical protein